MYLLKKIKVDIWVFFLIFLLTFLLIILSSFLVRQEFVGGKNFGFLSKSALFIAEIPHNARRIITNELSAVEQRFSDTSGFEGKTSKDESYLLLSRYDGDLKKSVVELIDLKSLQILKTWSPDFKKIIALVDSSNPEFSNLKLNINRFFMQHPFLTEDGGLIFKYGSPLFKVDNNSQLIWLNQEDIFHHSTEQDHEGNLWIPTQIYPYTFKEEYVGSKWDSFRDDAITKVSIDGEILFQKSVAEILLENNFKGFKLNGVNGGKFLKDPIHLNDIQPVLSDGRHWKRGDLFLSIRHQSMIMLYRPSTNKIIWVDTSHTFSQHDVDIIDDHRISIFNNNVKNFFAGEAIEGNNQILIYDFDLDQYSKYFNQAIEKYDIRTNSQGLHKILDNGELFIEEQNFGRLLYFNNDSTIRWQYVNRADDKKVYLLKWSRILNKPEDIEKVKKIIHTKNK